MRNQEAAVRWLRREPESLAQDLAARLTEIGYKLIGARVVALSKRLPGLRDYRGPTMPIGTQLDIIDHALCRTADAARRWEVNPTPDNDRHLTRLIEKTQDAIAQASPPSETALRLFQQITPDGLKLGLIQCEDCGRPLIAISIDADYTLPGSKRHEHATRPAVIAGRLSGQAWLSRSASD